MCWAAPSMVVPIPKIKYFHPPYCIHAIRYNVEAKATNRLPYPLAIRRKKIKGINILFAEYNFGWLRFGFLYMLRHRVESACQPTLLLHCIGIHTASTSSNVALHTNVLLRGNIVPSSMFNTHAIYI